MKIHKINFRETNSFSPLFLDYIEQKTGLCDLYSHYPTIENFKPLIERQSTREDLDRAKLFEVLSKQYEKIEKSAKLEENLCALKNENTFTITTGHQLNIFTGPLYFIYKLATTVNVCRQLKANYPAYHFVPVYWMASEDHDFEEINHFYLFKEKYVWETEQSGAVGRFNLQGMKKLLDKLPEAIPLFEKAYLNHSCLADATRYVVNELFGQEGLLVIDADNVLLKQALKKVCEDDLLLHTTSKLIKDTIINLEKKGYKAQVNPRKINLFYIDDGIRERIVKENGRYHVLNTDLSFSENEILELLNIHPEKFSPNVVLRPLYQELTLPNLAYIGGPSELAYWLQLKPLFDYFNSSFPILIPRNFALIVNQASYKKLEKLQLDPGDLFLDNHTLIEKMLSQNTENNFFLDKEKEMLEVVFANIKGYAMSIDKSLEGWVSVEQNKMLKSIHHIEKRLKKTEEKRHEISIKQLENIKQKLFPDGHLQERKDNFLNFYINYPNFIHELLPCFSPFDFRFNILFLS